MSDVKVNPKYTKTTTEDYFVDDDDNTWTHRIADEALNNEKGNALFFGDVWPFDLRPGDELRIRTEIPDSRCIGIKRAAALEFLNACAEFMGFSGTLTDDK